MRNFASLGALSAVCDSNMDTLRALGKQYPQCRTYVSYSDVLCDETIRAVAIATPAEGHADGVRESLLAGKTFLWKNHCVTRSRKGQNW